MRISKELAIKIAGGEKIFRELLAIPSIIEELRFLPTGATLCCARDRFCRIHHYCLRGSRENCRETIEKHS